MTRRARQEAARHAGTNRQRGAAERKSKSLNRHMCRKIIDLPAEAGF